MTDTLELRWVPHALSLEIRKVLSYRVDFWLNLVASLFARAGLAYFVWREIFALSGAEKIAGYDFQSMMMYYIIVAFLFEINSIELGYFFTDIYEGTLTRYLVFPLPFFAYKFVNCLAKAAVHFVQIGIVIGIFYVSVGIPKNLNISFASTVLGLLVTLLACYLTFVLTACLELVGFWFDKVWSLGVMLHLTVQFMGGIYLPISAFPEAGQKLMTSLPFYFQAAFPVRVFFGEITGSALSYGIGLSFLWAIFFSLILRLMWRRGMRHYAGAGQ